MKHDFEEALRVFDNAATKDVLGNKYETVGGCPIETIQLALRIADRLQKGDVSDGMLKKTKCGWHYSEVFKVMSQQLFKECEDETSTD